MTLQKLPSTSRPTSSENRDVAHFDDCVIDMSTGDVISDSIVGDSDGDLRAAPRCEPTAPAEFGASCGDDLAARKAKVT
jgi:hypothetical protein